MKKVKIGKAEAYRWGGMSSTGNAANMIFRQFQFPAEYDADQDVLFQADTDRLLMADFDGFRATLEKHLGQGEGSIGELVRADDGDGRHIMSEEQVMEFLKEVLKTDKTFPGVVWTGFRITGTVNRSNGFPVYHLFLFANRSETPVYSFEDAANVEGPNLDKMFGMFGGKRWVSMW